MLVLSKGSGRVRIGIEAPMAVRIVREERRCEDGTEDDGDRDARKTA